MISNYTDEDLQRGTENVEFCTSAAIINDSHVVLSQHLLSLFFWLVKSSLIVCNQRSIFIQTKEVKSFALQQLDGIECKMHHCTVLPKDKLAINGAFNSIRHFATLQNLIYATDDNFCYFAFMVWNWDAFTFRHEGQVDCPGLRQPIHQEEMPTINDNDLLVSSVLTLIRGHVDAVRSLRLIPTSLNVCWLKPDASPNWTPARLLKPRLSRFQEDITYITAKTRSCLVKTRYIPELVVLQRLKAAKVSFSFTQSCHLIGHTWFPISLPLQLCFYLAPFPRCYRLFPKYEEVTWPWPRLYLREYFWIRKLIFHMANQCKPTKTEVSSLSRFQRHFRGLKIYKKA